MPNTPLLSIKPANSSLELGKKIGSGFFFALTVVLVFVEALEKMARMCSCRGVTSETLGLRRMHCLPRDQKTCCHRWC